MAPRILREFACRLLLATLAGLLIVTNARAETKTMPAALIFDSSGSMAARGPDGRTKLDEARAVVASVLQKWPSDGELAVLAYGHRRKSDCSDIETIVPMGAVAPETVRKTLARLKARGKTPLSQSLRRAAALLPAGGGAVVLVSDGIETCDADPCAVAAALKKANAELMIHVVGFGLAKGEAAQLNCIAESAGGRFFDAGTAADLASALTKVVETVAAGPPPPAPKPAPPAPPPPPTKLESATPAPNPPPTPAPELPRVVRVGLVAVAGGLGRIVDAPVRWTVRDGQGKSVYEGESRALSLDLAAGQYVVAAEAANARGETAIAVTGAEGQSFDIAVQAGRLDLSLVPNKTAAPFTDLEAAGIVWTLEPKGGQGAVAVPPIARPSLLLAPGRYAVRAHLKGLTATAEVDVAFGASTALSLDFKLGTLVLEAALTANEPAITDAVMLGWRVGEGDKAQSIAGQARPRLVLPEGTYPVVLSIAGGEVKATAEVRADEERTVRVNVGGGELALSARLAPKSPPFEDWHDALWTVTGEEGLAKGKVIELPVAAPSVPVPPGRWRVTVQSGTVTAEREVTVGPGGTVPLSVDLDAARVTIHAAPAAGAEPAANTVFTASALGADGTPADPPAYSGGASEEVSTILGAGRWRVLADDSNGRHSQADLELGAGEERRLDLLLK